MDTDDLSIMAYRLISQAARGSDTLKAELGALSRNYKNEDDWLRGAQNHLQEIVDDPGAYVDYWNLEEEEGLSSNSLQMIPESVKRFSTYRFLPPQRVKFEPVAVWSEKVVA